MSCTNSQNEYTGDGLETGYLFTFEYEQQSEVQVQVLNTTTGRWEVKQQDDETYGWAFNGLAAITFTTAPADGVEFKIARNTIVNPLQATFYPGSSIRAQDLNNDFEQMQRAIEELRCEDDTIYDYIDNNYLEIETDVVTLAEQQAGTATIDDEHVFSTAASANRHDVIVQADEPAGTTWQDGKLWIDEDDDTIHYFDGSVWTDIVGNQGPSGTITVGTTTTSAAGGDAEVTNSGTNTDAIFDFVIPRGEEGPEGPQGNPGPEGDPGPTGAAATVNVGTTTTGAAGTDATVTNTGNENAAVFNFTIPRGDQGEPGPQGPAGEGVRYLGATDATTQNPPAVPLSGDFFINTTAGTALGTWTGLGAVGVNDRLIFNAGTGVWDQFAPADTIVNLGYTPGATNGVVTNTNGTNATIPQVNATEAGLMTPASLQRLNGIEAGAEVNVQSDWNEENTGSDAFIQNRPDFDLGYTTAATTGTVTNSAGTDATIPAATTTQAGLLTGADKTKLDGITAGAEPGTVTSVATSGAITGGTITTSGTITARDASTSQTGVVQLNDSTSSSSTTLAATSNAVRLAFNRGTEGVNDAATAQTTADAALARTGGTMTGDVVSAVQSVSSGAAFNITANVINHAGGAVQNPGQQSSGQTGIFYFTGAVTSWGNDFMTQPEVSTVPAIVPFYVQTAGSAIRVGNPVVVG